MGTPARTRPPADRRSGPVPRETSRRRVAAHLSAGGVRGPHGCSHGLVTGDAGSGQGAVPLALGQRVPRRLGGRVRAPAARGGAEQKGQDDGAGHAGSPFFITVSIASQNRSTSASVV